MATLSLYHSSDQLFSSGNWYVTGRLIGTHYITINFSKHFETVMCVCVSNFSNRLKPVNTKRLPLSRNKDDGAIKFSAFQVNRIQTNSSQNWSEQHKLHLCSAEMLPSEKNCSITLPLCKNNLLGRGRVITSFTHTLCGICRTLHRRRTFRLGYIAWLTLLFYWL